MNGNGGACEERVGSPLQECNPGCADAPCCSRSGIRLELPGCQCGRRLEGTADLTVHLMAVRCAGSLSLALSLSLSLPPSPSLTLFL